MRAEILTGLERRRRWSDAEKLSILADADAPGATVTAVAARRDVTRQQIYHWRSLRRKGLLGAMSPADMTFLAVGSMETPPPVVAAPCAPAMIEIALTNGRVLKAAASTPTATLKRLICAVERA